MYHIRLVKSQSYKGIISATRSNPDVYVDDKAVADKAIASGFFELVEDKTEANEQSSADLEKMTKAQLIDYARSNGISLDGCNTKAQILECCLWFERNID